jgi:hypothetical protein
MVVTLFYFTKPGFTVYPARSGNLSLLLFRRRGDVVASSLAARPERVRLVHDSVDDGVVAAVQGVHRILSPQGVA